MRDGGALLLHAAAPAAGAAAGVRERQPVGRDEAGDAGQRRGERWRRQGVVVALLLLVTLLVLLMLQEHHWGSQVVELQAGEGGLQQRREWKDW